MSRDPAPVAPATQKWDVLAAELVDTRQDARRRYQRTSRYQRLLAASGHPESTIAAEDQADLVYETLEQLAPDPETGPAGTTSAKKKRQRAQTKRTVTR